MEITARQASGLLIQKTNPEKAVFFPKFFKTGPGQYGEGDEFLGITVPDQRMIARQMRGMSLVEIKKLLISKWHEERLTAVFILVDNFNRGDEQSKKQIYEFYLDNTSRINNWDIVDSSAHKIVGAYLDGRPYKFDVLTKLANSSDLWEKRIAMIATFHFINKGQAEEVLTIAEVLVDDKHDLIQKAVGWMLREMGKKVDAATLLEFLDKHAPTMPRTALRYAIEKLSPGTRQHYLRLKLG